MIYDITQPLFECVVFPGDPKPEKIPLRRMTEGSAYNLTSMSLCLHNGTHVDAPFHFLQDGKSIDQVPLTKFIGPAWVESHTGDVTAEDAAAILARAAASGTGAEKRILVKGPATLSLEAALVFAAAGIDLFGNESQTVGPENAPAAVHRVLLGAEVVLLEGIRLARVPDGAYLLNCAPLNLSGCDGSPVRAVLLDLGDFFGASSRKEGDRTAIAQNRSNGPASLPPGAPCAAASAVNTPASGADLSSGADADAAPAREGTGAPPSSAQS